MFYGRAVLQCQLIGENFKENVTRRWDLDDTLLLRNGYSINDSKYTEELFTSGFRLVVHNFTENYLEKTYTCVYDSCKTPPNYHSAMICSYVSLRKSYLIFVN